LFCSTLLVAVFCLILPQRCPAPLVWRKGEGWTYERNRDANRQHAEGANSISAGDSKRRKITATPSPPTGA